MSIQDTKISIEILGRLIKESIEKYVEEEWEKQKESIVEAVEARRAEAISTIVLRMMKSVDMNYLGGRTTIIIDDDSK